MSNNREGKSKQNFRGGVFKRPAGIGLKVCTGLRAEWQGCKELEGGGCDGCDEITLILCLKKNCLD